MLKFRLPAVALLVALFGLLSATGAYAQCPYAIPAVTLDVSPNELEDGGAVTGSATSDIECDSWDVFNDFDGQTASGGAGDSFNFVFDFPEVDDDTDVTITAVCNLPDECSGQASDIVELESDTDDDDDDDGDGDGDGDGEGGKDKDTNGVLPDTGAPDQLVIGAGLGLIALGGAVAFVTRRRTDELA
jgi:LPXTG-motif cell wall-anchored protein